MFLQNSSIINKSIDPQKTNYKDKFFLKKMNYFKYLNSIFIELFILNCILSHSVAKTENKELHGFSVLHSQKEPSNSVKQILTLLDSRNFNESLLEYHKDPSSHSLNLIHNLRTSALTEDLKRPSSPHSLGPGHALVLNTCLGKTLTVFPQQHISVQTFTGMPCNLLLINFTLNRKQI